MNRTMEQLLRSLAGGLRGGQPASDSNTHPDTAESIHISPLALLKMMIHARGGVPLEVMGLMLGRFVDDYTIQVLDVFAMPQSGTSVTVESVDPVYQTKMMEMLKSTNRSEMVVGWYHSHPGFGCWLSSTDIQTQQSFESLHPRAVAVVVDPIQSVKGNVVLDAFRSINPMMVASRQLAPTSEPRQCTSNLGNLEKPSLVSAVHGLGTRYYSLAVDYSLNAKEQKMLSCVHKKSWIDGILINKFEKSSKKNFEDISEIVKLTDHFSKDVMESVTKETTKAEEAKKKYGKLNSKQRLEQSAVKMMEHNIVQELGAMINSKSFS